MRIDAQDFLRLAEQSGTIVFYDLEATGLKGDYNSILCVSIKPYGKQAVTYSIEKPGRDKVVAKQASELLEKADCWVTYYGKGFDFKMINTRLLRWGLPPLNSKPHIDMYYTLKYHLNTSRRSQAHLLDWLQVKSDKDEKPYMGNIAKKMSVSAEEWNNVLAQPKKSMKVMVRRCESDCAGLEALYRRTKHLIKDIK